MIGVVIAMQSEADILLSEMNVNRSLTVSGKPVHIHRVFIAKMRQPRKSPCAYAESVK